MRSVCPSSCRSIMKYHIRVLAGLLDNRAGSHVYNRELIRRLASRGHRLSTVCFKATLEVRECAEVFEVPPAGYQATRILWRLAPVLQHRQLCRALAALKCPPADVVVGAEHLFLKGHWKRFPQTPWLYLPHSLVAHQEIKSYNLPRTLEWTSL